MVQPSQGILQSLDTVTDHEKNGEAHTVIAYYLLHLEWKSCNQEDCGEAQMEQSLSSQHSSSQIGVDSFGERGADGLF